MIILTAEQASLIRGESKEGHALNPRPMLDGNYCLNEAVLDDPAHEKWTDLLGGMPRHEVTAADFAKVVSRRPVAK